MKIAKLWLGGSVTVSAVLAMAAACSASGPEEERAELHQSRQALVSQGLDFWMSFSEVGYVNTPSGIGAGIYYSPTCNPGGDGGIFPEPCDTAPAASDVTLTTTITGNVDASNFYYYGPEGFTCSQTASPGSITVTCHADSFAPFEYSEYWMTITPAALGDSITATTTLTEGGVEVRSETRQMTIVEPFADLSVWTGGDGTALVGDQTNTSFFVGNIGPLTGINPKLTLTLNGPGAFNHVSVFTGTCNWTDTTATCTASTFPVFFGVPVSIGFVGTDVGQVSITGVISSDTPDPYLANNEATASFDVVQPQVADLAISMTDSPDPVKVGKPLTYTISVTNNGPDTVNQPVMTDFLPYGTTFGSATTSQGSCWGGEWGYLTCELGPLAASESATITVVVTPLEGGTISNFARIDEYDPTTVDPDDSNNSAETSTTVKGPNPPVTVDSFSTRYFTALGAYVDCANEFVFLQGYIHASYQLIYNEKSGFYMVSQVYNPQGITGEGLNTGDTYHGTGMTRQSQRYRGGFPSSFTFENNFRIIGEKTGNDLLVHTTEIVTFNPDGSVQNQVTQYSFECK